MSIVLEMCQGKTLVGACQCCNHARGHALDCIWLINHNLRLAQNKVRCRNGNNNGDVVPAQSVDRNKPIGPDAMTLAILKHLPNVLDRPKSAVTASLRSSMASPGFTTGCCI
ncbi:MAG TPA: hypothetical protein VMW07_04355 [Gallionella sp.]|nr:hypothetical protein [Gallionella sp.]